MRFGTGIKPMLPLFEALRFHFYLYFHPPFIPKSEKLAARKRYIKFYHRRKQWVIVIGPDSFLTRMKVLSKRYSANDLDGLKKMRSMHRRKGHEHFIDYEVPYFDYHLERKLWKRPSQWQISRANMNM